MSKWKDSDTKIVQIITMGTSLNVFGLGNDSRLYQWDDTEGAWVKFWIQKDKPNV